MQSGEWIAYYDAFPYFESRAVRPGCHPRRWLVEPHDPGARATRRAAVLVHGLCDSPHYLAAIGRALHVELGYDVYLPLLQGHGLREPRGMHGVQLAEWKRNVAFALRMASERAAHVSIGGLSAGGALAFAAAATDERVTGDLFLFSAALDLAGGLIGELRERILRNFSWLTGLVDRLDGREPLVGSNPYRYMRVDLDGATELAHLMGENDRRIASYTLERPFPRRVFAAHSEADATADISGVERLQRVAPPERFTLWRIPRRRGVPHASLVLDAPVLAPNAAGESTVAEPANPEFDALIAALTAFARAR